MMLGPNMSGDYTENSQQYSYGSDSVSGSQDRCQYCNANSVCSNFTNTLCVVRMLLIRFHTLLIWLSGCYV